MLLVVLYGCETWSVTLKEGHELRVLRKMFEIKRGEVIEGWRKLHNEDLIICTPHQVKLECLSQGG
jgi:hypothetical protein